ncbi:hypothetical protein SAMN05421638_1802 [Kaistella treverensis]|uniref:Uncharacterized protein n=1 Tax=Kaistella treverensis TaxID=631455 RepID=A0A1I3MUM9_9FLAO|nr:hypothetical protein SAMN05421638_1802 [Kaistella treverensis]
MIYRGKSRSFRKAEKFPAFKKMKKMAKKQLKNKDWKNEKIGALKAEFLKLKNKLYEILRS